MIHGRIKDVEEVTKRKIVDLWEASLWVVSSTQHIHKETYIEGK
jgi:hypothetical protein